MSYTQSAATATCTLDHVLDFNDVCSQLYDYLTNHEGEIPEGIAECKTYEELADVLESYMYFIDGKLTITMDTEESNYDYELFDFLTSHYANVMSSKFMKVTTIIYDSRSGLSADVAYYDNSNSLINVEDLINSR